jgi:outer membrane cobalamin receptor
MTRTRTWARAYALASLLLSTLFLADVLAQIPTIAVDGIVKDASGGAIRGAAIEALVADRVVAATTSVEGGRYRVLVPSGVPLELRVRHDGFADYVAEMTGGTADLVRDVTLQIGTVSDTLVVTPSRGVEARPRSTSSVTVATADDFDATGASQLSDMLRFVPGVAVEANGRDGAVTSVFARGGESDYNLVLIDGVRVNQQGGLFDFSRIGAGEVERVEVVRGAQSALWGSDAIGSVVQVFTRRGDSSDAPRVAGSVEGGTFDTWRGDAHITGGARRRVDYAAGVTYRRTDGAFADILPQNDWFEQVAFHAGAGAALGRRASVRTSLRTSNTQGRSVGPVTFGSRDTQGMYDTKNLSWNTDASHALGERYTGTATFNFFRYEQMAVDTFFDPPYSTYAVLEGTPNALFPEGVRLVRLVDQAEFAALAAAGGMPAPGQFLASGTSFDFVPGPTVACPEPTQSCPTVLHRPSIRYQGDYTWAAGQRVSAGYEWEREEVDALPTAPLSTGFPVDNNAVFVQQQSAFADRWFVTFGLRVDSKEHYDTFVSPKLSAGGFVVPLQQGRLSSVKVFGNIGRGIKSPNFGERFGDAFADPNPDLEVERSRTSDLGVEATFASERIRASATYFNNDYTNQIAYRFGPVGDGIPEYTNIDGSDAQGWELEAALQRALHGFRASASYSFVDTRVVTNVSTSQMFQPGQPLLRRPRHSGFVRAAYEIGPATIDFDLRIVGDRHDSSFLFMSTVPQTVPNAPYPESFFTDITVNPGYAVTGLGAHVRVGRGISVYVRGNNITDTEYDSVMGYPGMPRTVMVGARFDVGR